jgi:hypothetical protein
MKNFLQRFSKAFGSLGGGSIGALIGAILTISGHPPSQVLVAILPIIGSVSGTTLSPPNSTPQA